MCFDASVDPAQRALRGLQDPRGVLHRVQRGGDLSGGEVTGEECCLGGGRASLLADRSQYKRIRVKCFRRKKHWRKLKQVVFLIRKTKDAGRTSRGKCSFDKRSFETEVAWNGKWC